MKYSSAATKETSSRLSKRIDIVNIVVRTEVKETE